MLIKVERKGFIHGAQVAKEAPTISHLFFADDNFLFYRANSCEIREIKEILEIY